MHRFEFTSTVETGNHDIDAHHRTLFIMANEILYSPELEESPHLFQRAVKFFVSYLDYHFASEEMAMTERKYPSRRFHSAFHHHIRREAKEIESRAKREGASEETRLALYFMIEDWLVYHVKDADRQLANYLREESPAGTIPSLPGVRPLKASGSLSADFDEHMLERVAGLG